LDVPSIGASADPYSIGEDDQCTVKDCYKRVVGTGVLNVESTIDIEWLVTDDKRVGRDTA
jgi:hypothetical protein